MKKSFNECLKKRREAHFTDKSCGVVGCTSVAEGRVLRRSGHKHKLTNFEYLCVEHWQELAFIRACMSNVEAEARMHDECLCCDPYKTKYKNACERLQDFKKKLKRNFGRYI